MAARVEARVFRAKGKKRRWADARAAAAQATQKAREDLAKQKQAGARRAKAAAHRRKKAAAAPKEEEEDPDRVQWVPVTPPGAPPPSDEEEDPFVEIDQETREAHITERG